MIELNSIDVQFIISSTIRIGFITGSVMCVVPWFIGYCIDSVLSVFKNIIK